MEKVTTKQLLDIAVEIVGLADRCHKAGLIDSWQASFSVKNENNYEFEVRVDPYLTSEEKWIGKAVNYDYVDEHVNEPNLEGAEQVKQKLTYLIGSAREELQSRLNILNGLNA